MSVLDQNGLHLFLFHYGYDRLRRATPTEASGHAGWQSELADLGYARLTGRWDPHERTGIMGGRTDVMASRRCSGSGPEIYLLLEIYPEPIFLLILILRGLTGIYDPWCLCHCCALMTHQTLKIWMLCCGWSWTLYIKQTECYCIFWCFDHI